MTSENYSESPRPVLEKTSCGSLSQRAASEIRGLMGARNATAADLAGIIGVSRSQAARKRNGQSPINFDELEAIAKWLEVPVQRIVDPPNGATYSK